MTDKLKLGGGGFIRNGQLHPAPKIDARNGPVAKRTQTDFVPGWGVPNVQASRHPIAFVGGMFARR